MKTSLFFLLTATATAFTVHRPTFVHQSTALKGLMTDDETKAIINRAHDCAESECSVEDVDMFLASLKEQQALLRDRLSEVTNMISELSHVNDKDVREVDEIRETVRAIARLFMMGNKASGNDYPHMGPPIGYSGEIGDGPKTAYDVLSPKKP